MSDLDTTWGVYRQRNGRLAPATRSLATGLTQAAALRVAAMLDSSATDVRSSWAMPDGIYLHHVDPLIGDAYYRFHAREAAAA